MTQFNKNQILEIHNTLLNSPLEKLYNNLVMEIHNYFPADDFSTSIEDTVSYILGNHSKIFVENPETFEIYHEIPMGDILTGNIGYIFPIRETSKLFLSWS